MHRNRHTKIVATLGPASSSAEMIQWLFERGVDVFRLNFSHGTHESHAKNIQWIRKLEKSFGRPIAILADLQGPKLRVGKFESSIVNIKAGQKFNFDTSSVPGTEERVQLPHPEIFIAAKRGDELLVDDGKLAFRVDVVEKDCIKTTALVSGPLSNNKGLNLPSTHLPIDILTEKDKIDLKFALDENADFIALSFVQTGQDILEARKRINTCAKIIAKIEKPQAIQNLQDILTATDGVMIARGDLGVELPSEQVPPLQRHILREAYKHNKPVIVATQMLESMIHAPKPTRAEASDVATAVYLGTDAVMLSAESAWGKYPKEAVEIMDRIIFHAEQDLTCTATISALNVSDISKAAVLLSKQHKARLIAALSNSFQAFASISNLKSNTLILALTSNATLYRQLSILYGVYPIYINNLPNTSISTEYTSLIKEIAHKEGIVTHKNQPIIVLTSYTLESPTFSGLYVIDPQSA